jgi:hypothetical protein
MKTASGLPCAFSVSAPLTCSEDVALYTPGESVWPGTVNPEGKLPDGLRPAASLYAVVRSDWATTATASAECTAPFTVPGGNPVIAVPGLTPRSPLIVLGPVLVTVDPASTAKLPAVPRPTGATAAPAANGSFAPLFPEVSQCVITFNLTGLAAARPNGRSRSGGSSCWPPLPWQLPVERLARRMPPRPGRCCPCKFQQHSWHDYRLPRRSGQRPGRPKIQIHSGPRQESCCTPRRGR